MMCFTPHFFPLKEKKKDIKKIRVAEMHTKRESADAVDDFQFPADPEDLQDEGQKLVARFEGRLPFADILQTPTAMLPKTILPLRTPDLCLATSMRNLLTAATQKSESHFPHMQRCMQQQQPRRPGRTSKVSWTDQESRVFFDALEQFGTDFSLISMLFPGKPRAVIKHKFLVESKKRPDTVQEALKSHRPVDTQKFEEGKRKWADLAVVPVAPLSSDEFQMLQEVNRDFEAVATQSLSSLQFGTDYDDDVSVGVAFLDNLPISEALSFLPQATTAIGTKRKRHTT